MSRSIHPDPTAITDEDLPGVFPGALEYTKQGFEKAFGINHVGHFLLFQLLKQVLLASVTPEFNSRVVMVTSVSHRRVKAIRYHDLNFKIPDSESEDFFFRYPHSKLASVYMANQVERLYGSRGLHAWPLEPGGMMSEQLQAHGFEPALRDPYLGPNWKTPEQGAATTVWAAISKDLEGRGGKFLHNVQEVQPCSDDPKTLADWTIPGSAEHTYNEKEEKKLWDVSEDLVKDFL